TTRDGMPLSFSVIGRPVRSGEPGRVYTSALPYDPFTYKRRETQAVHNIGGRQVPVVVADLSGVDKLDTHSLEHIGYHYNAHSDKWSIGDAAADFVYTGSRIFDFALPGTLQVICDHSAWLHVEDKYKYHPLLKASGYLHNNLLDDHLCFVEVDVRDSYDELVTKLADDDNVVIITHCSGAAGFMAVRRFVGELMIKGVSNPVVLTVDSTHSSVDDQLIHFATESGGLLLDGMGDGIWLKNQPDKMQNTRSSGRTYLEVKSNEQFLNNTAFSILQATRTRISKTEYISCPSCGRTLFDLQETTAKIRAATNHLKGVKIAIMGCIVNGPGEMADADFGYVGSGPGKITLYKSKDIMKKNVPSEIAVQELINLLKEHGAWVEAG
ncbi:MAG: 1-hydroxy-2-methyl-2-(E)-butenyl 4-diphosphate synthase, partial [Nitrosomonadaceae bacterium]|nr:1-hydroxy-2-methyl-2-(E)-butenyl 4-diphosphate synthase [Nitrosomonadaceae bacterium]